MMRGVWCAKKMESKSWWSQGHVGGGDSSCTSSTPRSLPRPSRSFPIILTLSYMYNGGGLSPSSPSPTCCMCTHNFLQLCVSINLSIRVYSINISIRVYAYNALCSIHLGREWCSIKCRHMKHCFVLRPLNLPNDLWLTTHPSVASASGTSPVIITVAPPRCNSSNTSTARRDTTGRHQTA